MQIMTHPFTKKNYMILLSGIALIVLGYLLMIGGGSDDPEVFNPAIFNFQRITLAPIVCLLGFAAIIVAIMYRDKSAENTAEKK
jgi:membrane-bound ClpP family serine protease